MLRSPSSAKESLYRLYIDEVGNHDMGPSLPPGERFLTLFGAWTSLGQVADVIQPEMIAIKAHFFTGDPDVPIVFQGKIPRGFEDPSLSSTPTKICGANSATACSRRTASGTTPPR